MINIFNLNKSRDEREINRFTTYRKILEKCHRRIQINSDKKVTHCIFTIPKMVIGLPAYDQVKCAEYCIDKLKKNGFVVIYTYPNLIYISWEHVPSAIKNPEVKSMELEIKTNPYKDFSYLIQNMGQKNNLNLTYFNKNLLEYNNFDKHSDNNLDKNSDNNLDNKLFSSNKKNYYDSI